MRKCIKIIQKSTGNQKETFTNVKDIYNENVEMNKKSSPPYNAKFTFNTLQESSLTGK